MIPLLLFGGLGALAVFSIWGEVQTRNGPRRDDSSDGTASWSDGGGDDGGSD
ncbi:hypothetical protein [Sphingomonas sp.]|uniref:hypothetical protein n=1 Tax=Sphingomonas sp. TaxID=28214 RepID=UPI003B007EB7